MKNPDRKTVSRLEALPKIGKATADDLRLIGIDHPKKLIGKDPCNIRDVHENMKSFYYTSLIP
jgi:hypothetical protein